MTDNQTGSAGVTVGNGGASDGMTGEQFAEFLKAMRQALKPTFNLQDKEWTEHGPAALARASVLGIQLDNYGGNCPVQIEGAFDGLAFYFRARGSSWQFHVAATDGDIFDSDIHYVNRDYGTTQFEAGWMPLHVAINLVCDAVTEFRIPTPPEAV